MNVITDFCEAKGLGPSFSATLESCYLPLLEQLIPLKAQHGKTLVLGINGAQGSGKSTLAEFLAFAANRLHGWQVSCLSLDDIYHTKKTRLELSQKLHPLMLTRGVPGTHDIDLGASTIAKLRSLGEGESLKIPRFDKAVDDRLSEADWPQGEGVQDLIIFEGWCLGCSPESLDKLVDPINSLEADEDSKGDWRAYVNDAIGEYQSKLWSQLDLLIMLRVPSFEQVTIWRSEQEERLVESLGKPTELSDPAKMKRFISHYERLTRHMLSTLGQSADLVMDLDTEHRVYKITPAVTDIKL